LSLTIAGCNIFGIFHSEDEQLNSEELVEDSVTAMENGNYQQTLELTEKGLAKEPDNPDLLYLHAVASLQKYNLDILSVIQPFTSNNNANSENPLLQVAKLQKVTVDTTFILDLTNAELLRLYSAFQQVGIDLGRILLQLEKGQINNNSRARYWYYHYSDLYLSAGIANIMTGLLQILDNDNTPNEFSLDPRVRIQRIGTQYQIMIQGVTEADVRAIVRDKLQYFKAGRKNLRDYYVATLFPLNLPPYRVNQASNYWLSFWNWYVRFQQKLEYFPLPENPPAPLAFKINNTPAGTIFNAGHEIYVNLWVYVY
jgi:hypothetical protein